MWLVGGVPSAINVHGAGALGARQRRAPQPGRRYRRHRRMTSSRRSIFPTCWPSPRITRTGSSMGGGLASKNLLSYGEFPSLGQRRLQRQPDAAARRDPERRPDAVARGRPQRSRRRYTNSSPHSWYSYPDDKAGLASVGRQDRHGLPPRAEIAWRQERRHDRSLRRRRQIQLHQGAALERPRHGSRAAGAHGHRLRRRRQARQGTGRRHAEKTRFAADRRCSRRSGAPRRAGWKDCGRRKSSRRKSPRCRPTSRAGNPTTANTEKWEPETWPAEAKGAGYCEAPRGALGHWIRIKDEKIHNYQCVVPTTWNASPRDPPGNIGAYEASLLGVPMADPTKPLEILRVIHSFDPCLACATHVIGPDGGELTECQNSVTLCKHFIPYHQLPETGSCRIPSRSTGRASASGTG